MLVEGCSLYKKEEKKEKYFDKRSKLSEKEYFELQDKSTTLYVGNLTVYTKEETLYKIFNSIGPVERIILGLNKKMMFPCGFCFVIYFAREDAEQAIRLLNGSKIDGNIIRVDFDIGFTEGRQYGRGYRGGQVRDEVSSHKNNFGGNDFRKRDRFRYDGKYSKGINKRKHIYKK